MIVGNEQFSFNGHCCLFVWRTYALQKRARGILPPPFFRTLTASISACSSMNKSVPIRIPTPASRESNLLETPLEHALPGGGGATVYCFIIVCYDRLRRSFSIYFSSSSFLRRNERDCLHSGGGVYFEERARFGTPCIDSSICSVTSALSAPILQQVVKSTYERMR